MNDSQKVNELRARTGADDENAVLLSYLKDAKAVILNRLYPYMDGEAFALAMLPAQYERKQIQIAEYLYNKRGAEGETQHIENGIHRNYKSGWIPEDMLRDIFPFVGIL